METVPFVKEYTLAAFEDVDSCANLFSNENVAHNRNVLVLQETHVTFEDLFGCRRLQRTEFLLEVLSQKVKLRSEHAEPSEVNDGWCTKRMFEAVTHCLPNAKPCRTVCSSSAKFLTLAVSGFVDWGCEQGCSADVELLERVFTGQLLQVLSFWNKGEEVHHHVPGQQSGCPGEGAGAELGERVMLTVREDNIVCRLRSARETNYVVSVQDSRQVLRYGSFTFVSKA